MGIVFQLKQRFDPPNLEVKATVFFMFYGFLFLFLFFFGFLFCFLSFAPFCHPSYPPSLTRLARPRFLKKLSRYNRKAYTFPLDRTTGTLEWACSPELCQVGLDVVKTSRSANVTHYVTVAYLNHI